MKRLFVIILILAIGTWLGLKMQADPGYVMIVYRQWSIETSLWLAILALIISIIILFFLFRLLQGVLASNRKFQQWKKKRRRRYARRLTNAGFRSLAEGQWEKAEKQLIRRARDSEVPFINYLAAARAAQAQGRYKTRDDYLRQADRLKATSPFAVALSQAQLQLDAKQYEQAVATLNHLHQKAPDHSYVLFLLKEAYEALGDWEHLYQLLPLLAKRHVLTVEAYQTLESDTYFHLMERFYHLRQWDRIDSLWKQLPRGLRYHAPLVVLYVDSLKAQDRNNEALSVIQDVLKKEWDPDLVARYAMIQGRDLNKQLSAGESWLKHRENDPTLLLTLGRLSKQLQLWGKAREYLQRCIQSGGIPQAYLELAQVFETLDEPEKAFEYYKTGLERYCESR